ncbi:uncharacterized protein [Apostichopus japonicus]
MANASPATEKLSENTKMNFGRFKVRLAELLTTDIILSLATFFMFPPAKIDEIRHTKNSPGQLMVSLMEERGQIKPNDISPLLTALDKLELYGLLSTLHRIFPGSEDKTCLFVRYLKTFYKQLYSKIHPIPYIREKLYCVNDVFVEGGIEMHGRDNKESERPLTGNRREAVKLNSYRDVFNDDIISSKRILLEGDPGYGKSTFTLQAAFDWCIASDSSPLKGVDIFILLPLRLLGGIFSICLAIKLILMPGESKLTEEDIMEILLNSRVVLILDGYDEYPDKDIFDQSEIMKIISGNMFANFKVITCTRSAYLPDNLDVETVKVRLTGFDDNARDDYIRRAVAVNDNKAARRINDLLTKSPVLSDICQVPLFCVMFVHISYEEESVVSLASVTSFFSHILTCFYAHMRIKTGHARKPNDHSVIPDYPKLNKLLFDALTGKNQQIVWQKNYFKNNVGDVCYNELITIGILIEDDILKVNYKPGMAAVPFFQQITVVRFYHKLFAEWYAANYLSKCAGRMFPLWLRNKFKKINPVDLQFVFRFACGLNKKASSRIIKYLKGMKDGQSFASLCFFEQVGEPDDVVAIVKDLLTGGVTIGSTDSRLLQRSTIQILDIAAKSDIPITSVCLDKSFKEIEEDVIVLHSGRRLNQLLTVEKIHIETEQVNVDPRILTEEDVTKIFRYGLRSQHLKELSFAGCTLPLSFPSESLHIGMSSRDIKVCWSLLNREIEFLMNVQSGQFEVKDKESLRRLCSKDVFINENDHYLQQCLSIISVQTASYHNIPISRLHLKNAFSKIDAGNIILHSGLRLPCPATVKQVVIERREMTETECFDIMMFVQQSHMLEEIEFDGCLLPLTFSSESIPAKMQSRAIKVYWNNYCYSLNLQSGVWEVNEDVVRKLCTKAVHIRRNHSEVQQRLTIQLLEDASNYDIPISSVFLQYCSPRVDDSDQNLILQSGLSLSILSSLQKLVITDIHRSLTNEELAAILSYSSQCASLNELQFLGYVLPDTFPVRFIPSSLKSRKVKVWNYSAYVRRLNLQTGRWQVCDKKGNLPGEK